MKIKIAICLVVSVLVCACSSTNQCKVPKQEGISLQQKRDKHTEDDTPFNSYYNSLKASETQNKHP